MVVDPRTGEKVGGFAGAQTLPLIIFRIGPDQSERIPLLTRLRRPAARPAAR
jgi:hypothetical protein